MELILPQKIKFIFVAIVLIFATNLKAQTKSFLIPHPLDPQNKLLVSKVLKGMFPEKTKDREWEEQWQGPCFGVHIGCEEGLRRSKYVTMHVGDKVRVFSYRKLREDDSRIGIICTYMLSLIMTIFVVVLFIYAMRPHE